MTMITLPVMSDGQSASWHGLLDLYDELPTGWTLIGGQLVHLHCAEREYSPPRPTDDIDAVLDPRANPQILMEFTTALEALNFAAAGSNADGAQHRWKRGDASIDILIPENVGEKAALRKGSTGSRTVQTPGGIQALRRTQTVAVSVGSRQGFVRRPNLVGALIGKAAARTIASDVGKGRHLRDFATLSALVSARDFRDDELSKGERRYLRDMIAAVRADVTIMAVDPDAASGLERLERAAQLKV